MPLPASVDDVRRDVFDLRDWLGLLHHGQFERLTRNANPESNAFAELKRPAAFRGRLQNGVVRLDSA